MSESTGAFRDVYERLREQTEWALPIIEQAIQENNAMTRQSETPRVEAMLQRITPDDIDEEYLLIVAPEDAREIERELASLTTLLAHSRMDFAAATARELELRELLADTRDTLCSLGSNYAHRLVDKIDADLRMIDNNGEK